MRSWLLALGAAALAIGSMPAAAQDEEEDVGQCEAFACEQDYSKAGLPVDLGDRDCIDFAPRCFTNFALLHNNQTKVPDWVIESLDAGRIEGPGKRKNNFRADKAIPPGLRAELRDYKGSKHDRGHQAPAGDNKQGQGAMDESFFLSNMAPQVGKGFNQAEWRFLEEAVRGWILCGGHKHLFVMTGPIYTSDPPETIKNTTLARPDEFFKIAYDPDQKRAIAFRLVNQAYETTDLAEFRVSIDEIERATGYDFLAALPKRTQTVIEKSVSPMWGYDKSCDTKE